MPKLNSIIICDKVEFDSSEFDSRKKLNIYGIFDSIYADNFPVIHSSLTVFVHMEIKQGKHKHSYDIIREEDKKIIFSFPEEEFTADKKRHQLIHEINNLLIERAGKYIVNIYVDGEPLGSNYFFVKKIQ